MASVKKSLFSRPKWAAQQTAPAGESRSIFEQNVYADIVEADRRREEKRLARQRQKDEEKRRTSESKDTKVDEDDKPVKKQRVSIEPVQVEDDDDDDDDNFDRRSSSGSGTDKSDGDSSRRRKKSASLELQNEMPTPQGTPRKGRRSKSAEEVQPSPKARNRTTPPDEDGGEEGDFVITDVRPSKQIEIKSRTQPPPPPPPPADEEDDSDPDEEPWMKELKREARARARATKSASRDVGPRSPTIASPTTGQADLAASSLSPVSQPIELADPEIKLRITSIIPSCHDTFVVRKASQTLAGVRKYYVGHFQLKPAIAEKLFFTWNDSRLFDSTTMRSILTQIEWKYSSSRGGQSGYELSQGLIEIEAVTDEIFAHRLEQKERERQRKIREPNGGDAEPDPPESDPAALRADPGRDASVAGTANPEMKNGTVIQLKPSPESGLPSMNLRVHPHTTVERIVRGYKKKMGLDVALAAYLVFDGEVLDGETTVDEVGFEEGDTVDVGVKDLK